MGICLHQADGKYTIAFEGQGLKEVAISTLFQGSVTHKRHQNAVFACLTERHELWKYTIFLT